MNKYGILMKVCGIVIWAAAVILGLMTLIHYGVFVFVAVLAVGFCFGSFLFGFGMMFSKMAKLSKKQEAFDKKQREILEEQIRLTSVQVESEQWQRKVETVLSACNK